MLVSAIDICLFTACKDNLCDTNHTRRCRPICDAYGLGPNKERYSCRCKPQATGVYCNVTDSLSELCKSCPTNRCYPAKQSKGGYFCYTNKWAVHNKNDVVGRRFVTFKFIGGFFLSIFHQLYCIIEIKWEKQILCNKTVKL